MRPIIRVEKLSKQYRIGARQVPYLTLRESIINAARSSLNWFRRNGHSEDNTIWALKDVSFEVMPGEVIGVIGRNGAGKSTLLKILSRIAEPTAGQADLYGRVGSLLEVGTGFHPELTGRENIYLNGAILGMRKAEIDRKFDEIVFFAEVEKFIDTAVKRYSSGMYMRLAFAVAAHLDPEILLVDEVLAVGDVAFQKKCLGKMGDVAKEGRTVLFVTHNMSAILNLCRRAILLQQGALLSNGPAQEIVESYMQSFRVSGGEEIASYPDRIGEGRVRFMRVWFEDERGSTIEQAMSGQSLIVALEYCSQVEGALLNCRLSIAVEDLLGRALFVCSTELVQNEPLILSPRGIVRCRIPSLPLSQGRYNLTLFLEVNREIQDWLQSTVPLDVLDGDFFGTGRQYPGGWQGKCVLVPHEWEVFQY
jgi:lipopolysaccharide transport system ATP-binding protein